MRRRRRAADAGGERTARPTGGPEPPSNVRIRLSDGSEQPVELLYAGYSDDVHRWVAVPTAPIAGVGCSLLIDALPPHTSVSVAARRPAQGDSDR